MCVFVCCALLESMESRLCVSPTQQNNSAVHILVRTGRQKVFLFFFCCPEATRHRELVWFRNGVLFFFSCGERIVVVEDGAFVG